MRTMPFSSFFRVCSLLLMISVCARDAWGQSLIPPNTHAVLKLETLIENMRSKHPSLLVARFHAAAEDSRSRQAGVLPDPAFSLTYQPLPILTAHGYQRTQWRLEQEFPYPGKRSLERRVANIGVRLADLEADALELDLVFEIKQAYHELYRIQEQEKLIGAFQEQLRAFEAAAAVQYEVGTGTQQAILKAQLEHNMLSTKRLGLDTQRQTVLATLSRLAEVDDERMLAGRVIIERPEISIEQAGLIELALAKRPEAEALRQAQVRADAQVALARKAFYPDLKVSLSYFDIGNAAFPGSANGRDAIMIGGGIKIPLWRDRLKAGVEAAEINQHRLRTRYQSLETALRTQIDEVVSRLGLQQEQLRLFQSTLIPQAETALEATLHAYATGRTDFLNLLDAQRLLFSLRMDYEETYKIHLNTIAQLDHTIGIVGFGSVE